MTNKTRRKAVARNPMGFLATASFYTQLLGRFCIVLNKHQDLSSLFACEKHPFSLLNLIFEEMSALLGLITVLYIIFFILASEYQEISVIWALIGRSGNYINAQRIISTLRKLYQRSEDYIDVRQFPPDILPLSPTTYLPLIPKYSSSVNPLL